MPTIFKPIYERYYVSNDGCWMWTGGTTDYGYGKFSVNHKTIVSAHRYFFEFYRSVKIPKGMHLDHLCNRPGCVNPNHLEIVTPRENTMRCNRAPAAINSNKTECIRGHRLSGDNLYMTPDGRRQCRICRGMSQRKHRIAR